MFRKSTLYLMLLAFYSFGGEFTFSIDTVWEDADPFTDSGYPLITFLKNSSNDSIYIDSINLLIDTIIFPHYEISWRGEKRIFNVTYKFGNWPEDYDYPPVNKYKEVHSNTLMRAAPNDSLKLDWFFIEKRLKLYYFYDSINNDSIVPISVKLIFISEGYADTLILNGLYNYDLQPVSIENISGLILKKEKSFNKHNIFYYDCLGRKYQIYDNLIKYNTILAKGIYFSRNNKSILIINNYVKKR